jgi:hypothetical protein
MARGGMLAFSLSANSMDYEQLVTAIDVASQALLGRAAKAVNQALVLRNWPSALTSSSSSRAARIGQRMANSYSQIWRLTSRGAGSRAWGLAC